jgi:hypothetical protein
MGIFSKVVLLASDVALNDSDKTFTVPATEQWRLDSIGVNLATTADAGNRRLAVLITTAADVQIAGVAAGLNHPASTTWDYTFANDLPRDTSAVESNVAAPLPRMVVPGGYKIVVKDLAAIQAAADDMKVYIHGENLP